MKVITYSGQRIKGVVHVSYKIDGVRVFYKGGKFVTRNDKTPPGLLIALTDEAIQKLKTYKDCEIFTGSFISTNSRLQTINPEPNTITSDMVYPIGINKPLDRRLYIKTIEDPEPSSIEDLLKSALDLGYEGLVLRTEDRWYRVKPTKTADVYITGWFEQLDKNKEPKNQLGGFTTNYGNVTAFTDQMRKLLWDNPDQYIGKLMEVEYKELYHTGSFRYAVKFIRFRDDKNTESFDI